jgi:uncharacterized phage protein (TIGR02218 family)
MAENRVTNTPAQVLHGGGTTSARVTTEFVQVLRSLDDSGDPYFADVVLLSHMDGTNGSTTFTDDSSYARTLTARNGGVVTTAQKKWGTGSLNPATTDAGVRAAYAAELALGTGDYTVECFFRTSVGGSGLTIPLVGMWGVAPAWYFYLNSGLLTLRDRNVVDTIAVFSPTANTWYHLAASRVSGTTRLFIDGVQVQSSATPQNLSPASGSPDLGIGYIPGFGLSVTTAFIDDVRITKGVGRYTATFPPPSGPFPNNGASTPIEIDPTAGQLEVQGFSPDIFNGNTVAPIPGTLEVQGLAPDIEVLASVTPLPGELIIQGFAPELDSTLEVSPISGALEVQGAAPEVFSGITITPEPGELIISGAAPFIALNLEAVATQSAVLLLGDVQPEVKATQSAILMLGEIVPAVKASQSAIMVLVDAQPCVSRRADVWVIHRRDGVSLAFTGHDRPIQFGELVATPCGSLTPTAVEQAAEISSVGNLELAGLVTSSLITEADLYGGLYDDALVEVWRVSWDAQLPEPPIRMAAGYWGNLRHGDDGFSAEILGPAARLQQQALVQMVTPGCRRVFGSPQGRLPPGGCGVDLEARKRSGEIDAVRNRAAFTATIAAGPDSPQWANGTVEFLSGPNAGQIVEVKSADLGTGEITLWTPTSFLPNVGDDFELRPGCDKLAATCKLYANYINFGGFPDIPGTDAISETPDAKL